MQLEYNQSKTHSSRFCAIKYYGVTSKNSYVNLNTYFYSKLLVHLLIINGLKPCCYVVKVSAIRCLTFIGVSSVTALNFLTWESQDANRSLFHGNPQTLNMI